MSDKMRHAVDRLLTKVTSRKLMVWGVATVLTVTGSVSSGDWVAVSLVYIGSEAAVDLASVWRHGR